MKSYADLEKNVNSLQQLKHVNFNTQSVLWETNNDMAYSNWYSKAKCTKRGDQDDEESPGF